ncbi:acyltransferase [Bacillus sp. V5-8f]|uniref:acyltransferase n=1 Tax=Bacillus sp. V5-8f TaxID=2053044 RepID=UPI000C774C82|nr:acyltransferase family protein [Bacillus sp. V5-8f]PLT33200.1 acyltransferase [Bacillus sp. V5-8f]
MERNTAIDFIKFFAISAVLIIHIFPRDNQMGLFVLDNLSRFAVPFFFIASGYFFGNKILQTSDAHLYFKKYIVKIIKLYISWLIFYMIYDFFTDFGKGADFQKTVQNYLSRVSLIDLIYYGGGTSGYQLWFLTALIWSLTIVFICLKLKKIKLLLSVSFILHLIGLFGQSYSVFFDFPESTRDPLFFGLFYTTMGCFFVVERSFIKARTLSTRTCLSLIGVFSVMQVTEGYILEKMMSGNHGEYFISTIFLSAFLFLFSLQNPTLGKGMFITKIGARAVGIYIVHVFFINLFDLFLSGLLTKEIGDNLFVNLIKVSVIFSISYVAYDLLQELKRSLRELW